MKLLTTVLIIFAGIVLIGWLGLQVPSGRFEELSTADHEAAVAPLPGGLPAPVAAFYETVYGSDIPVIESGVISGRGTMRIKGITMPVRWQFSYRSGQDYRHDIVTTWFGMPILRVKEYYYQGVSRLELPFGVSEGPKVDQGANLGLWAEMIWMPSVWLTDPRVSWEGLDPDTAVLKVPFGEDSQRFIVRFDPDTHLIRWMESMRYKGEESRDKVLWMNQAREWNELAGFQNPTEVALIWMDEGTPWAQLSVEEIVYNLDTSEYFDGSE